MKKMTTMLALAAVTLLTACSNPYMTARLTILGGRAVVPVVDGVMATLDKNKQAECGKKGKAGEKPYDDCYAGTKKMVDVWGKSKPVVLAGFTTGESIVDSAEKANNKNVKTWIEPVRKAICLADKTLVFLPKKAAENIWVKTVRGFAVGWAQCGSKSWRMPTGDPRQLIASLRYAVSRI